MEYKRIAIDTSKAVFTLHGVDKNDRLVLRGDRRRNQVLPFFKKLADEKQHTEVVMEACGATHHWGRELQAMGHTVKLIPPQYVKPFVKRGKNDRNDAAAIYEAASRPDMSYVPVKSADQQASLMVLKTRELFVKMRTQTINALRGHASEFGVVAGKGTGKVTALLKRLAEDQAIPPPARQMMAVLGQEVSDLDSKIAQLDSQLKAMHKTNAMSQALEAIPGVGPVIALTLALSVNAEQFQSSRHFAAWLGLTPQEHSSGGKQRLGRISRAGHERLRQLLVVGAMSVVRQAAAGSKKTSPWLLALLNRRPRKVAAVALANKIARIAWAMMRTGEAYRDATPRAA